MQENFANDLLYSSQERLARALPSITQLHKDDPAWPKVTQQELANMIGVTRQRVDVILSGSENQVVIHCADRLGTGELLRKTAPA